MNEAVQFLIAIYSHLFIFKHKPEAFKDKSIKSKARGVSDATCKNNVLSSAS